MPTATDLVTDLPADFEVFGQAVDTRLKALQPGTTLGDIVYSSATANTSTRLPIGTTGQVLSVVAGVPAWQTGTTGDITAVTAGTGITGGGTSGDVTVSFDQANFGGGQFAAGKNKIINGDFRINQRAFTSNTTSGAYNFDRFLQANSGGTFTVTPQTFTPGAAPVAGYEGSTFLRGITASQSGTGDYALFEQKIEDVRTLAGSTAVVSFWAKAASGTPKIGVELSQNFGSGGSPSATVNTALGAVTLSTSWARYSISVAVPSISGKTIGTTANTNFVETNLWVSAGSAIATRSSSIGIQNNTFDVWGIQVEAGSTETPFQTASGSVQGELALCQRYFEKSYDVGVAPATVTNDGAMFFYIVSSGTHTQSGFDTTFKVTKRSTPTMTWYSPNNGASGNAYSAAGGLNVAVTNNTIGTSRASVYYAQAANASINTSVHFTASAEL